MSPSWPGFSPFNLSVHEREDQRRQIRTSEALRPYAVSGSACVDEPPPRTPQAGPTLPPTPWA
jgi:hypothetical protein